MNSKKLTFLYSLIQGAYWMLFAIVSGLASVYLLGCGFASHTVGIMIAVAGGITAVLQPVLTTYADLPQAPSIRRMAGVFAVLAILLSLALYLTHGQSILLTCVLFCGCYILLLLLMPFVNALGTEFAEGSPRPDWGIARGIGSLAYAGIASLLGWAVAQVGVISIPISMAAVYGLLLLGLCLYPFRKITLEKKPAASAVRGGFLKRYPSFLLLLCGMAVLYTSHVMNTTYLYQIVLSRGGGSAENGNIMSLCALVELPALFLFSLLLKKWRCETLYRVAAVFMALKALGMLLSPSVGWLYGAQLFQALGWGLIAIVPVHYVKKVIPEEDAIKGQGYMAMTNTLANAIGSLAGGWLIDLSGVQTMMIVSACCGALGAVLVLLGIRRRSSGIGT